jgi:perosamine synthetase
MKTSKKNYSRRAFVRDTSLTGLGAVLSIQAPSSLFAIPSKALEPAILGGEPVRSHGWPEWPIWNPETDEEQVLKVLRGGVWSRAEVVNEFEKKWAELMGARRCLAVVNGTNALVASLVQLDIGGGDEVIVTPYTWISSIQAVLLAGAMPVFADIDPATYQIDPVRIEEKIGPRTRAIMPVHILGLPADMDRIMAIARKHNLLVLEDACQAWLAEVNHRKVGTIGHAGCFSFQTSKHMPLGEGGAIISDDEAFMDRCYSYHNVGFPYGVMIGSVGSGSVMLGTKLRITEYQAAIGLAQMQRLVAQTDQRNDNAARLRSMIDGMPGIVPYRLYENVTKAAFHFFPFRYKKEEFQGLSRSDFLKALQAEGIPCLGGYAPYLNNQPYLENAFQSKNFRKMYPADMLDFRKYAEQNKCPENDLLCEESVWVPQNLLLGTEEDLRDVARAIEKTKAGAARIKSSSKK